MLKFHIHPGKANQTYKVDNVVFRNLQIFLTVIKSFTFSYHCRSISLHKLWSQIFIVVRVYNWTYIAIIASEEK